MLTPVPPHDHAGLLPASLATLNALDWGLVLMVGTSTVTAFLRGLIRSLVSAVGVLAGLVLAAWYAPALAAVLVRWLPQGMLAQIAAYLLLVTGTYLVAVGIGRILRGAAKAVGLGLLDRLGGAAFGFGRAVLVLAAVLIPATPFLSVVPLAKDSVLLPYLQTVAHGVSFVMPQDFRSRMLAGSARRLSSALPRAREFGTAQTRVEGEAQ